MTITCKGEELILDKERAIYLPNHRLLAISDLHLGKSAHFRQAGLQIPENVSLNDLERLDLILKKYNPKTLLINGDMFHHGLNADIDYFRIWREQRKDIEFLLVKGNHDLLNQKDYEAMDITLEENSFCLNPFCFIHDAPKCTEEELYPISGHVHPGVSVVGKAKQRLKFPCFYFGRKFAVLPAFSSFTGLYQIKRKIGERIFAITPQKVVEV